MSKPVIIYTTQTCGYCKAAKDFMNQHSVAYQEIDVGRDRDQARIMIEKSGQMGVPVISVGEGAEEQVIIGFDRPRLAASLGINV